MIRFVTQRIAGMLMTCLITSIIVFMAVHLAPGDPVAFLFHGHQPSAQQLAAVRSEYHLNDSLPTQYWLWLGDAIRGHFGQSIAYDEPVSSLIAARLPSTLWLLGLGLFWTLSFGIPLGAWAARRRGAIDDSIMTVSTVGMATPSFVLATVFIAVFAVDLHWFPVLGSGTGVGSRLYHLVLPSLALAVCVVGLVARTTRAAVREELGRDHVVTAEARGLKSGLVFRRHAVRNALGPISTVAGLSVASLLAGTAIIETAFGLNGVGSLLISSVENNDFPVVQAVTLIFVVTFVVVNTIVDLVAAAADPRVRTQRA